MNRIDRIALKGLRVKGFHGVFEHERRNGQEFVVDAELSIDTRDAAAGDDLTRTVDYAALATALADVVRGEPVALLETLAEALVEVCLAADPQVRAARVRVHKPQAPIPETLDDVTLTVHRRRDAPPSAHAVLALGANLGDRLSTLQSAVEALAALDGVSVSGVSPVVETAAVGGPPQPDYLNAVVRVRTDLTPAVLLAACHGIEAALGRRRGERWGPRTIDIDVVVQGGLRRSGRDGGPQLPHPRAAERAFVLHPWALLDPEAELPGLGRVAELAERAGDRADLRVRTDLALDLPPGCG